METPRRSLRSTGLLTLSILAGLTLLHCSSSSSPASVNADDGGASACFPDNDGITGGDYVIELTVNDTGFFASGGDDAGATAKNIVATQNAAQVTLTLTNMGTKPHGFAVQCTSVTPAYPNLPAGCPTMSCFPTDSTIAPIAGGTSKTITFDTPVADELLYPFNSNEASDGTVAGLSGQWSLM